jgi:hypothetical protein
MKSLYEVAMTFERHARERFGETVRKLVVGVDLNQLDDALLT